MRATVDARSSCSRVVAFKGLPEGTDQVMMVAQTANCKKKGQCTAVHHTLLCLLTLRELRHFVSVIRAWLLPTPASPGLECIAENPGWSCCCGVAAATSIHLQAILTNHRTNSLTSRDNRSSQQLEPRDCNCNSLAPSLTSDQANTEKPSEAKFKYEVIKCIGMGAAERWGGGQGPVSFKRRQVYLPLPSLPS